MYTKLFKNATILDGTGSAPVLGDIAIQDDKIVAIAPSISSGAHSVIDVHGLVVAPGFIDAQNHSDSYWQLLDNPSLDSMRAQGYTTVIVGHCGGSLAPLLSREALLSLQKWHSLEGVSIDWASFGELVTTLNAKRYGCNVASLVGYSTLRRGLVGSSTKPLQAQEIKALQGVLADSFAAGALGLSHGLSYGHELSASKQELTEIARTVAAHNKVLSVHLRDEGAHIVESLEDIIALAQETGVRIKISHLKIQGREHWSLFEDVLSRLEDARFRGLSITFDVYPYDTVWQVIARYLPSWAQEGGSKYLLETLRDPIQRKKVLSHLHNYGSHIGELFVVSTSNKLNTVGKRLSQIAKDLEVTSEEALVALIENGGSEILVLDQNLDWKQVQELLFHPLSFIATDGAGFPQPAGITSGIVKDRLVHPRCFGTAPRYLKLARESNTLSLSEAISKLTQMPAMFLGLTDRGTIAVGKKADLVVFNPSSITDTATLINPYQFPKGIEHVMINGEFTLYNGTLLPDIHGSFI